MPAESIMNMVNNVESLYNDKNGLYRKWVREGKDWDEKRAFREARTLAAHFAEAIETMPWPELRPHHYTGPDFDEAAAEMIEEFKTEELPKWSDVPPEIGMGAAEGWVVTHDGETIKAGFKDDFAAAHWLHNRYPGSVDHAVRYAGYDIVLIRNGKVITSYLQEQKKERPKK